MGKGEVADNSWGDRHETASDGRVHIDKRGVKGTTPYGLSGPGILAKVSRTPPHIKHLYLHNGSAESDVKGIDGKSSARGTWV